MEIKTAEEVFEDVMKYAYDLQAYQIRKKKIDDEIKAAKQIWKENGVAVGKVTKVLGKIKAKAKMSEADLFEEELLEEKLSADDTIQDNVAELNAPSD